MNVLDLIITVVSTLFVTGLFLLSLSTYVHPQLNCIVRHPLGHPCAICLKEHSYMYVEILRKTELADVGVYIPLPGSSAVGDFVI